MSNIVRTNDAANSNENRHVTFLVEPAAGERAANNLVSLSGPNTHYPRYGKIQNPTLLQELAQLRLSLITRVATQYAILVGVQVVDDTAANANGAVRLTFETDRSGVFYNNAWGATVVGGGSAADKHSEADIVDTVGIGGLVTGAKTKPGLETLLQTDLATVSYDGGATDVFGAAGNITLPDGRVAVGGGAFTAATIVVDYLDPLA